MSVVRNCKGCGQRIEPEQASVRVSRQEPTDLPGSPEPVIVEQPGFVHEGCEQTARLAGWRRARGEPPASF
jgi:hypothetical protein